jgi:uncharacterized protein YhaN
MRFVELRLIAFGHFTDRTLSFAERPLGLHVIHGHNEAGKSTALRAVHDLLFGVPQQSPDTFLHSGPDLRIGALLEDDAGNRIEVLRRKGRKNTLLDPNGAVLDENVTLRPLLGHVDETLFRSMFGLDHESLRHGAKELLSGQGTLSESLFGAGGSGHTHRLLRTLRERADELFTARGRGRRRINVQIQEVRDAQRLVVKNSTTAQGYQERWRDLEQVSAQVDQAKRQRTQLHIQKGLLDRRLRILPLVAKLHAVLHAENSLGRPLDLPDAIEEWRNEALAALKEAEQQRAFSATEVERHVVLLSRLDVPQALSELDWQGTESLSQRLGQSRKARLDLPKREAELRSIREDAKRLLLEIDRSLSLERAEALQLSKSEEQRIRRLCAEKVRLDATLGEREQNHKESQRQAALRRRELDRHRAPRDTAQLRAALERARAQLDVEERLDGERRRAQALEKTLSDRLGSLSLANGRGQTLLDLPLPDRATVARFQRSTSARTQEVVRMEELVRRRSAEAKARGVELDELVRGNMIPSEDELFRVREERDQLLYRLEELADGASPAKEVVREVRRNVERSDNYADRLRLEAARVSRKASLEAALRAANDELGEAVRELEGTRDALRRETAAWHELWAPFELEPSSPDEMAAWIEAVSELRAIRDQLNTALSEIRRLEGRAGLLEKALKDATEALGEEPRTLFESFAQFVQRCQGTLDQLEAAARTRRDDEQRLRLAQDEEDDQARRLAELREAQRQFRGEWAKVLRSLGLDKDKTHEDVTASLDQRAELFHKLSQANDLERRIQGIVRDEKMLEHDVRELTARVAPELNGLPFETAAERLLRAHKKALEDSREKVRVELELERHQKELEEAKSRANLARERIGELLHLARVESIEELMLLEKAVQQGRVLARQRADLEDEILSQGEGATLPVLLQQAEELGADALRERSSQIDDELDLLNERLESLVRVHTQKEALLQELGEGAAAAAEELAQRAAGLRASVRRFLRFRLASAILGREVERYREEHQGPVLRVASQLFARLTLGAYSGLRAGFDESDEPLLLCVTSDGREKRLETLSDGGRDQLFLSLRLATMQDLTRNNVHMPLVLDDALVHFDDDRARAALAVLGEVAVDSQVLFFTHHARLVQLAEEAVPSDRLGICQLHA